MVLELQDAGGTFDLEKDPHDWLGAQEADLICNWNSLFFSQGSCRDCNERCCGFTQIDLILYRLEGGGVPLVLGHQVLSPGRTIKDLKNVIFYKCHQRTKI